MFKRTTYFFLLSICVSLFSYAQAAFVAPGFSGNTEYEGWSNLYSSAVPGGTLDPALYGIGFPGAAPWTGPLITGNETGSAGNATFYKTAGNGYAAGASIYTPFSGSGNFEVDNATPLSNLANVLYQIDIGPGSGNVFFDNTPVLNYNGGSQALVADIIFDKDGAFPFTNPVDPTQAGTTTIWGFQWDLSGILGITDFDIDWKNGPHAQIYALQLDTSDIFTPVPIPAAVWLFGAALFGLIGVPRRKGQDSVD
ncbi:MAG: VPLPA-CTERM sorting domain-containing protein [Pseudomonadota bacterium]